MFNILVVEDDNELCELFCTVLKEKGYNPIPALDGEIALDILDTTYIDLMTLDVMMPKMSGYELAKVLRDANYVLPILMITAKETMSDKREGFRSGIDDYMVKPIDVNEMVWRIEALLRRSQIISDRKFTLGETLLDYDSLTVSYKGNSIELPQKEFLLLFKLLSSPNHIFTRQQLMNELWGPETETDTHTLDVHIYRLREKFKDNPDFSIVTVRGLGYKAMETSKSGETSKTVKASKSGETKTEETFKAVKPT